MISFLRKSASERFTRCRRVTAPTFAYTVVVSKPARLYPKMDARFDDGGCMDAALNAVFIASLSSSLALYSRLKRDKP